MGKKQKEGLVTGISRVLGKSYIDRRKVVRVGSGGAHAAWRGKS